MTDRHGQEQFNLRSQRTEHEMRHRLTARFGALLAGALLFASTTAGAQGTQGAQQACASDIQKYCAGIPQGGGKIAECLRANEAKLTPACKAGMAKMAGMMEEVVSACEDDLHRFCAGATPGTARECLRTNFRELSMPCKRELFEAKKAS
jgi:cysteine rich repeat protein